MIKRAASVKHSEKDKNDLFDPAPELQASSVEIHDGLPRLRKPELRLELKLKQRNRKEIRE